MSRRPPSESVAEVEVLLDSDTSEGIARRLGYSSADNLRRIMRRAGRIDLVDQLGPQDYRSACIRAAKRQGAR